MNAAAPARFLAWSLLALWGVLVTATIALELTGGLNGGDATWFAALTSGYAIGGTLVALRQPRNSIGWIMLVLALVLVGNGLASGYVEPADDPRKLVAGDLVLAYYAANEALWIPLVGVFLPLLFPDGRLPSRRWRPLAWIAACGVLIGLAGKIFAPGVVDADAWTGVENPFGLDGVAGRVMDAAPVVSLALLAAGVVGAGASVVVRFRRSRGVERQRMKWFAFMAALLGVALFVAAIAASAEEAGAQETTWGYAIGAGGWFTALAVILIGFPAAIGLAVFRYRLYDVDLVINRTLVYGSVTALLAGTYVGLVLLFQLALRPVTKENGLAIAISTLAVAALFRPARARIQALVDRRFYRHKYDAERTLAAFAARLRDEVDLDALRGELTAVIAETMQPAHVSLWLRDGAR